MYSLIRSDDSHQPSSLCIDLVSYSVFSTLHTMFSIEIFLEKSSPFRAFYHLAASGNVTSKVIVSPFVSDTLEMTIPELLPSLK